VVEVHTVDTSERSVTFSRREKKLGSHTDRLRALWKMICSCRACVRNGACYTPIAVQKFLVKNQIQTISQPPYFSCSRSVQLLAFPRHTTGLRRMLLSFLCLQKKFKRRQQRHSWSYRKWTCRKASRKIRTAGASVYAQKGSALRVTRLGFEACPQNCEK
jgi:hypothetical protein